jgi:hypothetical protein
LICGALRRDHARPLHGENPFITSVRHLIDRFAAPPIKYPKFSLSKGTLIRIKTRNQLYSSSWKMALKTSLTGFP